MVFIILIILVFNIPFLNVIITSLKSKVDLISYPPKIIFKPTFEHFENIFTSGTFRFGKFLYNSFVIALVTSLFSIILTLPAAYYILFFRKGKRFLLPMVTNLRSIPLIIFAMPIYLSFKQLSLIDTRLGLIIVHLLVDIPISLVLLVNFLQSVPKEIIEAARIDGAAESKILIKIIPPMVSSSIVATFILCFIYSWNEFLFALILSIKNTTTLTVGATLFITAWGVQWGEISAAIVISTIIPFVLTFYIQKHLIEAYSGGLKE